MLSEEKIALSKIRLDNAKERIAFADEILAIGDYKTVANRSYYAVFSAMRAVLALDGIDSKKHSGLIAHFRQEYIKTGIIDVKYSDIIQDLSMLKTYPFVFCQIQKSTQEVMMLIIKVHHLRNNPNVIRKETTSQQ